MPTLHGVPWNLLSTAVTVGAIAENEDVALGASLAALGLTPYNEQRFSIGTFELPAFTVDGSAFAAIDEINDRVIISFRGTDPASLENLGVDIIVAIQALLGADPANPGQTMIEAFSLRYMEWVEAVLDDYAGYEVVFAGHSLGGMVAEQYSHWFRVGGPRNPGSFEVSGVVFGSPGIFPATTDLPPGQFFHIARMGDTIGNFQPDSHLGPTLLIDDGEINLFAAHNHDVYAEELSAISRSPTSAYIPFDASIRFLHPSVLEAALGLGVGGLSAFTLPADRVAFFGSEFGDRIDVGIGGSVLDSAGGNDTLNGSASADVLSGGLGNDLLSGGDGSDVLFGWADDDGLEGGGGDDTLVGNTGGDRYSIGIGQGSDVIDDQGSGSDTIALFTGSVFSAFDYSWFSRDGADLLIKAPNGLGGFAIDIRIRDMGDSSGEIERIELFVGAGTELTDAWDLSALWAGLGTPGDDHIPPPADGGGGTSSGGGGNDYLEGGPGRDVLDGGAGDDVVIGFANADKLIGGTGNDQLDGGSGDDSLNGGAGADNLNAGSGIDWLDGGADLDFARVHRQDSSLVFTFASSQIASASGVTLADGTHLRNIENFDIRTGSGNDQVTFDTGFDGWANGTRHLETGAGDDQLTVTAPWIRSMYWIAGEGIDTLVFDFSAQDIGINAGGFPIYGATYVVGSGSNGLGGPLNGLFVEDAEVFKIIGGSGQDFFNGRAGADTLIGNGGNDHLDGHEGDDSLSGGAGNDIFTGGEGDDWIDGGADLDFATVHGQDSSLVFTFASSQIASASGVTLADGTHLRNIENFDIRTGSGNDQVTFDTGFDGWANGTRHLETGAGADQLTVTAPWIRNMYWIAGEGTDTLVFDFSAQDIGINAGGFPIYGATYVVGSGSNGLGGPLNGLFVENAEVFKIIGGSGQDFFNGRAGADTLVGNGGNDHLDGHEGDDSLSGGAGNDILTGGEGDDWIDGGADLDFARVHGQDSSLAFTFASSQIASASGVTLADGTHLRNIENFDIRTGSGNDQVTFDTGFDGWANGTRHLETGAGDDQLTVTAPWIRSMYWIAGEGIDTLVFDFSAQDIGINAGGFPIYGATYVVGSGSNGLGGPLNGLFVEDAEVFKIIGGSGQDFFNGRAGADTLIGNGGNDHLDGREGDDSLSGGAGNDILTGGEGDDWIDGGADLDFATVHGQDSSLVFTFASSQIASASGVTLADGTHLRNIENFDIRTGSGNDQVTFDTGFDGWANGTRHLETGAGADQLTVTAPWIRNMYWIAGEGTDTLVFDFSAQDIGINAGGFPIYGATYVVGSGSNGLGGPLNGLFVEDAEVFKIIGGSGQDFFNGRAGADTLIGNGGNDHLDGREGDDSLSGGAGNDILTGGEGDDTMPGGAGNDYIGGGSENDSMSGADGNDTLEGGSGDDVLAAGRGVDVFVFGAGFGHDTIIDFRRVEDEIRFVDAGFADFADMMAHALQVGRHVVITNAAGDSLQLNNVLLSGLQSGDFLFS